MRQSRRTNPNNNADNYDPPQYPNPNGSQAYRNYNNNDDAFFAKLKSSGPQPVAPNDSGSGNVLAYVVSSKTRRKTNSSKNNANNNNNNDSGFDFLARTRAPTVRVSDPIAPSQVKAVKSRDGGIKSLFRDHEHDQLQKSRRESPLESADMSGACGAMYEVKPGTATGITLRFADGTEREATQQDVRVLENTLVKVPVGNYGCIGQELHIYESILGAFERAGRLNLLPVVRSADGDIVTSVKVAKMPLPESEDFRGNRLLKYDANKKVVAFDPDLKYPIYERLIPLVDISEHVVLTSAHIVAILEQLLAALVVLDRLGMTYYDLKRENFLFRKGPRGGVDLVVADIGSIAPYDAAPNAKPRTAKVSDVLHRRSFVNARGMTQVRKAANAEWSAKTVSKAGDDIAYYDKKGVLYSVGVLVEELATEARVSHAWLTETIERLMFLEDKDAFRSFDEALAWAKRSPQNSRNNK